MLSAERLIDLLERRKAVSARLIARLRAQLATANRPMPAESLARFLVQKKHLPHHQALEMMDELFAAVPETPEEAEMARIVSREERPEATGGARFVDLEPRGQGDEDEDFWDESSIFAPSVTHVHDRSGKSSGAPPSDEGEEIRLAPADDDDDEALEPAREFDPRSLAPVQHFDELRAVKAADEGDPKAAADPFAEGDSPTGARVAAQSRRRRGKPRKKPQHKKSEWDSPLLLVGGGALALLALCAVTVTWLLYGKTGDDQLRLARSAVNDGSYTQAIAHYQKFLEGFPHHSEWRDARVQLAMVRVRQTTETSNYVLALKIATDELEAIEQIETRDDADAWKESYYDLADLLPRIARGLADEAEAAADPSVASESVDLANAALTLCTNTKFVPKSLRDETRLNEIQETLDRVARRQQSQHELERALQAMETAIAGGEIRLAYNTHRELLQSRPELADNPRLTDMVAKTSASEQATVRFVVEEQAPVTAERPVPWEASLVVALRRARVTAGTTGATSGVACVLIDGAVYGLEVDTGRVLWRRFVGFATSAPIEVIGQDVLVNDAERHELLRLDARTGKLQWRQVIGEPFAGPLVVGDQIYVAAESGRLYVLRRDSGIRTGYLQFAQPLRVPPAADRDGKRLYLTGDHSSVYSVSLADLTCLGVYYLGHSQGSIRVSPARVLDRIALLENDGVETSRLHVLSIDEQGAVAGKVTQRRLNGLASVPPLVSGRRLIIVTDRGAIEVYELGAGTGDAALTSVATRPATGAQPLERHVLMTAGHVWVADAQLTKYAVLPTGNRLPVEDIDNNFAGSAFDHALELFGATLVHVRRPANRAGVTVAAIDTESGRTLWETDLAVPPAWSPIVDEGARSFAVANANGFVFRFDRAALRSGVRDEALEPSPMPPRPPALTAGVDLGGGRAAFTAATAADRLLLYDPSQSRHPLRWIKLPSRMACGASKFGDGLLAPLQIGQVLYIDPAGGQPLATPFQPRLQARTTIDYQPAGEVGRAGRQFVITDGREQIYLVGLVDQPQPHLVAVKEAMVGTYPIISPIVVLDNLAYAVNEGQQLARFRLPSLEVAGETNLPEQVLWGPYVYGKQLFLVTADDQLHAVSAGGELAWSAPLEHGDLAGPPLPGDDGLLLAYKNGVVARHRLQDGKSVGELNVRQPLAAAPIHFSERIVLAAHDGTLLVIQEP